MEPDSSNIASRYLQRRVLLLSLVPLAVLFVITITLARTYHVREEGLAGEWFQQGNTDLATGKPGKAFEDFRNSLSYDPENNLVQLRLAEALLADGRLVEARSYLANLWDKTPGSGEVNLDLAHLSARTEDAQEAIRYFRSAIYGSWDKEPSIHRRNARFELCEFLLMRGQISDARAEIAGLAADLPPDDVTLHDETGQLFLRAGEPRRALAEFEDALLISRPEPQLLEDAGKAAYATGDYAKAERYLTRANREHPSDETTGLLAMVREILDGDPFQPGLSDEEQTRRSWAAFRQGLERLQKCTAASSAKQTVSLPVSDLQDLIKKAQDLKARVNVRSLRRNSDLRNAAVQFAFNVEETTSHSCGTAEGQDQALILISQRHAGTSRE